MPTFSLAHGALLVLPLAAACVAPAGDAAEGPAAEIADITGSVTYRERIALAPDAVLHVRLHDLLGAAGDGPETVAAVALPMGERSVPFDFRLPLEGVRIRPDGSHVLTARIASGGGPEFATERAIPVLGDGATGPLSILLRRAGSPAAPTLAGTRWRAVALAGRPVTVEGGRRAPFVLLREAAGTYTGHGGVNLFGGSYALDGDTLRFAEGATTLMAGPPEAMALERDLLAARGAATGHRIEGDQLVLTGAAGTLARFEAVPLD